MNARRKLAEIDYLIDEHIRDYPLRELSSDPRSELLHRIRLVLTMREAS